jgi:hypothetical protein
MSFFSILINALINIHDAKNKNSYKFIAKIQQTNISFRWFLLHFI